MAKSKAKVAATVAVAPQVQVAPQVDTTPAPAKKASRYATTTWQPNWLIGNVVPNPKRGKSKARFDLMRNGQTVAEYCAAVVNAGLGNTTLALADLRWGMHPTRNQFTITPPDAA